MRAWTASGSSDLGIYRAEQPEISDQWHQPIIARI